MENINDLKDFRLHDLLRLPQFDGIFSNEDTDEEKLIYLFSETTHAQVWVTDDDEKAFCIFVFDTNGVNKDKLLAIENRQSRLVFLWSIDGKMFKKRSKCDCAVISDKVLHFIEFKANVVSENLQSIGDHYDKASSQLSITFKYIQNAYAEMQTDIFDVFSDVDAQIVFDRQIPQNNAYQKKVISAFNKANGIALIFGNELKV